jgi:hypothetical protein
MQCNAPLNSLSLPPSLPHMTMTRQSAGECQAKWWSRWDLSKLLLVWSLCFLPCRLFWAFSSSISVSVSDAVPLSLLFSLLIDQQIEMDSRLRRRAEIERNPFCTSSSMLAELFGCAGLAWPGQTSPSPKCAPTADPCSHFRSSRLFLFSRVLTLCIPPSSSTNIPVPCATSLAHHFLQSCRSSDRWTPNGPHRIRSSRVPVPVPADSPCCYPSCIIVVPALTTWSDKPKAALLTQRTAHVCEDDEKLINQKHSSWMSSFR